MLLAKNKKCLFFSVDERYKKVKVNILSPTRFHVLDLARELNNQGFDVRFYSLLPRWKCVEFGLPRRCCGSLFLLCCPMELFSRFLTNRLKKRYYFRTKFQDVVTSLVMRKADVTIAMSGQYVESLKKAKANDSIVILERGSMHILEQKRILGEIPDAEQVSECDVNRELEGYKIADYVSIPSSHVKESFLRYGYDEKKLFINPYGTDLSMFYPIFDAEKKYDVIMVGNWSFQKGCDKLTEAIRDTNISFLHVGQIKDLEFPKCRNMYHIDSVDQKILVDYYNQAKMLIFPSRQDGYGLVLLQALACGIPIVCSKESAGRDLKIQLGQDAPIVILEDISCESIRNGIEKGFYYASTHQKLREINQITWEMYGKRYGKFIMKSLE